MPKITRVAIANRGEVAVRIIRACQEMGIETVLLHSEADVQSLAFRISDRQFCIGSAPVGESYLNIERNIHGALSAGAHAIHPGFGFLSENPKFADACEKAGIIFVGPSGDAIRKLGDKIWAKEIAVELGIPCIPGYQGNDQTIETLVQAAQKIGFPVLVKAAAGGGGRGMKILRDMKETADLISSAQREAQNAFGSPIVFLEKYLDHAKHIEFQIFGDATGRAYSLFERECSVQRRHQKIIEEAIAVQLDPRLREKMAVFAMSLTEKVGYKGAGTVEFLVQDDQFYFLEMNTRLQVEHPVTELVLGVDLVKAQLLTAQGQPLPWEPSDIQPRGHSIECRLYAEDPYNKGLPSTGVLGGLVWPDGPGRRFDVGFEAGDEITSYYDPMIAKIIVWDESRPRAIKKKLRVLDETVIFGVKTNIPFLKAIISHPEFVSGRMNTRFIENHFPEGLQPVSLSEGDLHLAKKLFREVDGGSTVEKSAAEIGQEKSPWDEYWRIL